MFTCIGIADAYTASPDPQNAYDSWPSLCVQTLEAVLEEQAQMCQDILQMEEQASLGVEDKSGQKWPLLTLARLREVQHQMTKSADSLCQEAQHVYGTLIDIDPLRRGYYMDAMQGKAAQVTTSSI